MNRETISYCVEWLIDVKYSAIGKACTDVCGDYVSLELLLEDQAKSLK